MPCHLGSLAFCALLDFENRLPMVEVYDVLVGLKLWIDLVDRRGISLQSGRDERVVKGVQVCNEQGACMSGVSLTKIVTA